MAKGGNKLSPHAAQLEAWAIQSVPVAEQQERLAKLGANVAINAVYKWQYRHAADLAKPKAVVKQVVIGRAQSLSIADKTERIRRAALASDKLMEWIETHGLIMETQRVGDDDETIIDRRFNRGLVSALVDLNTYVSKELGEFQADQPATPSAQMEVYATFQTLVLTDPAARELAQRLFVSAAMGARDAGGARLVRKRGELAPGAPPDDDQRRVAEDRQR